MEHVEDGEDFAATGHPDRVLAGQRHVGGRIEEEHLDVAEALRTRQVELAPGLEVLPVEDGTDAEAAQGIHPGLRVVVEDGHDTVEATDRLGGDEGDGVADGPGDVEQRLGGLVAGPAPRLPGEGGLRDDERARARRLPVEHVRRLLPVPGHIVPGAARQQAPRPGGGQGRDAHHQHQGGRRFPTPRVQRPRQRQVRAQPGHADEQGDADERVELVEVAEGGEGAVEKREPLG